VSDFVLVLKNLFRKKLRTVLMIVSILVAFQIFGVLASFEWAFNSREDSAAVDRLIVTNKINQAQQLPVSYFNRVAALEGVRQAGHASWFGGYYQDPKSFLVVFAVDPESYTNLYDSDFVFEPQAREGFIRDRAAALVGERMMAKWGWKVGDTIPLSSNVYSKKDGSRVWDVKIVGTFAGRSSQNDSNLMLIQYDYLNENRVFQKDLIGWIALRTASPDLNDKVARAIDATFANSADETTTDSEKVFTKAFAAQFGNIALIVGLVVGAAFVTILMIVGNTMAMSIRERTREIGVLKTLGFSGARILRMVLAESTLLAVIGGAPGLALAAAAIFAVRDQVMQFAPTLTLPPVVVGAAFALMLALGVLTGLFPALSAMRLKIADALGRS
jgi:putative ABC transport system permease protein